jgi:hypothetical protein
MKIIPIIFVLIAFLVISCDSGRDQDGTIHVHKPKQDYSSYVPIELSPDKTKITSAPGGGGPPLRLVQGYFLGSTMGINTAYLSLTHEEYNSHDPLLSVDGLYKYILEPDPFLEYYVSEDIKLRNEDGIDTVFINDLIRESKLTEYFNQLK